MYHVQGIAGCPPETVLDAATLGEWIQAGRVRADTLVKAPGAAAWVMICTLAEFQGAFTARTGVAPPPAAFGAPVVPRQRPLSRAAVVSLVLGVLGLCTFGVSAVAGIVVAVVALARIKRSQGQLRGGGLAIAGLCLSSLTALLLPLALLLALPPALKARARAQAAGCIRNLREMDAAKEWWALEGQKAPGDVPAWNDLVGKYLPAQLKCPRGGVYTIGPVAERPQCSLPGHTMNTYRQHHPR